MKDNISMVIGVVSSFKSRESRRSACRSERPTSFINPQKSIIRDLRKSFKKKSYYTNSLGTQNLRHNIFPRESPVSFHHSNRGRLLRVVGKRYQTTSTSIRAFPRRGAESIIGRSDRETSGTLDGWAVINYIMSTPSDPRRNSSAVELLPIVNTGDDSPPRFPRSSSPAQEPDPELTY